MRAKQVQISRKNSIKIINPVIKSRFDVTVRIPKSDKSIKSSVSHRFIRKVNIFILRIKEFVYKRFSVNLNGVHNLIYKFTRYSFCEQCRAQPRRGRMFVADKFLRVSEIWTLLPRPCFTFITILFTTHLLQYNAESNGFRTIKYYDNKPNY